MYHPVIKKNEDGSYELAEFLNKRGYDGLHTEELIEL